MAYPGQVAFAVNGVLQPITGLGAQESLLAILGDGTILLRQQDANGPRTVLGIGSGTQRQWIRFTF